MVNGGVQCWGDNAFGQLGNNSTVQNNVPVQAIAAGSNVTAVSVGYRHSCAAVSGGEVCWGNNDFGQLADAFTNPSYLPVAALTLVTFAPTTTTVTTSASPVTSGSPVTFTVAVKGNNPAGTVNFKDGASSIAGCGAVTLSLGSAQCVTSFATIGTKTINAVYSGDTNNAAGTGTLMGGQVVVAPTITLSPASLPSGTLNAAYSQSITAVGGIAAYSFAVNTGDLPTGLMLSSAGLLSGTPTAGGTFNFTVTATDANGFTGAQAYAMGFTQTLTVFLSGNGQGSVTGTGISCPGDCSEAVAQNAMVSLTATPAPGSIFAGWIGSCSGTSTCTVTMNAAASVTAQFTRQFGTLNVALSGLPAGGSVALTIAGPDGYSTSNIVVSGTTLTLNNLPTGTYTVNSPSTKVASVFYTPIARLQNATVNVGMTTGITVTYAVSTNHFAPIIDFVMD